MSEGPHVLLANADPESRTLLRQTLEQGGFGRVTEAAEGAAAVERLNSAAVDLLVTDIPLDGLDGWRLARLVRSGVFQCHPDIPIVVVTRSYSRRIADVTAKEFEINRFLPFERRHRLPEALRELTAAGERLPPKGRLLVVEDAEDTIQIVSRVLGKRFDIEVARDGQEGLEAWQARRHDLVLLDVMLPGLPGPRVLEEILAIEPEQTVVIMTADGTPQRAGELVLRGAADFIAKPFRAEQLRRVCEIAARRDDYLRSNEQFAQQLAELTREKERVLVTLESIGDGVITTDVEGRVEYLNPVGERLTGWSNRDARGRPAAAVFRLVNEFSHRPVADPVARCLAEGRTVTTPPHSLLIHHNGSETAVEDSAAPIKGRDGTVLGAVLVFHDVTEARTLNRQLSYQAAHDSLTGLLNRAEFERRLARLLEDSQESGSEHVLCYLDLDQFKVVNDTCGHAAGDRLLEQVAMILQGQIRQRDTLARLGGDEFGILLEYCGVEKAYEVADQVRKALQDYRFPWDDKLFAVGASVGVVPITPATPGIDQILSTADAACYLAKEGGRNRIHVYREDDRELVQRHGEMQWVAAVTRAIEEGRFRLYYQTIEPVGHDVEAGDRYELLLRMVDESGELVPPGFFLPAVERYDLAVTVDKWVIRNALEWLRDHPERLERLHYCSINLSGKSLGDEHFHDFVAAELERTGVPPASICFEITETAAITNLQRATQFMRTFKRIGCRFALDDFGSGMSSFAYLKTLPVDYLKIDGVFVEDIVDDPIDRAMVRSINEVGHTIGLETIAEFVENAAILGELQRIGVDYAQGYGISQPRPLDEMVEEAETAGSTPATARLSS